MLNKYSIPFTYFLEYMLFILIWFIYVGDLAVFYD